MNVVGFIHGPSECACGHFFVPAAMVIADPSLQVFRLPYIDYFSVFVADKICTLRYRYIRDLTGRHRKQSALYTHNVV